VAPPASSPAPRRIARSMFSFGTEFFFAFCMASYKVGLPAGSPPPVRAATSTFLISRANNLPRLASTTAFLCLVVAHFEWPDITPPMSALPAPSPRRAGGREDRRSALGETRSRAGCPAEPRQSYPSPRRPRPAPGPRHRRRPPPPTARG